MRPPCLLNALFTIPCPRHSLYSQMGSCTLYAFCKSTQTHTHTLRCTVVPLRLTLSYIYKENGCCYRFLSSLILFCQSVSAVIHHMVQGNLHFSFWCCVKSALCIAFLKAFYMKKCHTWNFCFFSVKSCI